MNPEQNAAAAEAVLFASGEPLAVLRLAEALECTAEEAEQALLLLEKRYNVPQSGLCLLRFEDRVQLASKTEFAVPVRRVLDKKRNAPLSNAALETLAVIAYNQPVSRAFIEQVRGVDSSSAVSGLLEKGLIEEAGRLDVPGRPTAFRTTDTFLRCFGLGSLAELPPSEPPAKEEDSN